jgi:hypothetical protein
MHRPRMAPVGAIAIGLILVGTAGVLVDAFVDAGPIWALELESVEWSTLWLLALAVQAYGACMLLCALIVASEGSKRAAAAWVFGILAGGGVPIAALYFGLRLVRHGTLSLSPGAEPRVVRRRSTAEPDRLHSQGGATHENAAGGWCATSCSRRCEAGALPPLNETSQAVELLA